MKTIALLCTCMLLIASLSAQTVFTGPGGPTRIASSHPLSYWMADPLARDRGGDFTLCLGCKTDEGRVVTREDYTVDPEIHRLGPLSGHQVVDIIDHIHSRIPDWPNEGIWHIVLVETSPGQFTEIYREQTGVDEVLPAKPARAVKVGSADILAVCDPTSGNDGGCSEGYWWFDAAGPHPVDFDPVYKAIGEKTPKDSTYTVGCWTIDLDRHQIHTNVQKIDADCHACGQLGTATASFEIVRGVAKPVKVDSTSIRKTKANPPPPQTPDLDPPLPIRESSANTSPIIGTSTTKESSAPRERELRFQLLGNGLAGCFCREPNGVAQIATRPCQHRAVIHTERSC